MMLFLYWMLHSLWNDYLMKMTNLWFCAHDVTAPSPLACLTHSISPSRWHTRQRGRSDLPCVRSLFRTCDSRRCPVFRRRRHTDKRLVSGNENAVPSSSPAWYSCGWYLLFPAHMRMTRFVGCSAINLSFFLYTVSKASRSPIMLPLVYFWFFIRFWWFYSFATYDFGRSGRSQSDVLRNGGRPRTIVRSWGKTIERFSFPVTSMYGWEDKQIVRIRDECMNKWLNKWKTWERMLFSPRVQIFWGVKGLCGFQNYDFLRNSNYHP